MPPPDQPDSRPPQPSPAGRPRVAPLRPSRDSVTTIQEDGSRPFLYPADVRGRFKTARTFSAFLLIAFYLSLPWIKINGYPAVFLDAAARRFHLFGLTLGAQDMWLIFFVITGVGFSLFFVTAMLGRIWCGWACPHTVFLDHIYRRIERWIEGSHLERRALAAAPASAGKLFKRIVKHALYLLASTVIAHLFLAYFVSIPELWVMMRLDPVEHWSAFMFIAITTGALYFNFAWFREQLCIVICPYGRLQSALIDDHSLVIGYDAKRGEPRGKIHSAAKAATGATLAGFMPAKEGDCVDCARCVQVCPTGIDIRQGLQMECIGCTACIDACDDVMSRLKRPKGLIRYDSQTGFSGEKTRWIRPRTFLYGVLLLIGILVATWALSTVRPFSFGVTRITGTPYVVDATTVRNQFFVRLVNKRNQPVQFQLTIAGAPADFHQHGFLTVVDLPAHAEIVQPLVLQQGRENYQGPFELTLRFESLPGRQAIERKVEFLGPDARLLREDETP